MAKKESLVKLAKSTDKKTKSPAPEVQEKPVEKILTPDEERDLKAKARVDELLEGVELTPKKEDELLEVVEEPKEGADWLEEQVQRLSEENERLKSEAALAKEDYSKLYQSYQLFKNGTAQPDAQISSDVQLKVIQLFSEIQQQYLSLGTNFYIHPPSFLLRLVMFFPFLENEKRF